jgi:hypothetical protein
MPSILVAICVSSDSFFGSFGAGIDVASLSRWMPRAVSGLSCRLEYCFEASTFAPSLASERSFALAATSWLSLLM